MPHTSLNESQVTLVNQSLYSSVEIRGTKSLKDQDIIYWSDRPRYPGSLNSAQHWNNGLLPWSHLTMHLLLV